MENSSEKVIVVLLSILSVVALGFVIDLMRPILFPFFMAVFLVLLLDPLVDFLVSWKVPIPLATFVVIILAWGVLYLLGLIIYSSVQSFITDFPKYEQRLTLLFEQTMNRFNIISKNLEGIDWKKQLSEISIVPIIQSVFITGVGSFVFFLGRILLISVLMIYLMIGKRKLPEKIEKAFSNNPQRQEQINNIIHNIDLQIQKYLGMKTLISFITGLLITIALSIIGVDFAIIWGLFAFFLNFIPNIGSIFASLFPILVAFLQFESFIPVLWVIISMLAIQLTMGNVVEPQTMGHRLNLSPLFVFISLVFWGWIWGIGGMLLAVPILAVLKTCFQNIESLKPISVLMSQH